MRNARVSTNANKRDRADETFQNIEEIASPNRVGFDSLESAVGDQSKVDLKTFDILH